MADETKLPLEKCPACGMPKVAEGHFLVLYFASLEGCRKASVLLQEALPTRFMAYTTEGEIDAD